VKRDHWLLVAIVAAAAALRVYFNNAVTWSRADERVYTDYSRFLLDHSYRELVRQFLDDSSRWVYPNPLRWGYFLLTSLSCRMAGHCDERLLAWLSTAAGVACVWLTFRLGETLVSRPVGLWAAALTIASPLQLALGRRALQDELFCAVVLLSFIALAEKRLYLSLAAITLALAIKETFFLLYPALFLIAYRKWEKPRLLFLFIPPFLYFFIFVILSGSPGDFFHILSTVAGASGAPYAAQYQAGPPHRILLDLFTLSPLITILAISAIRLDLLSEITILLMLVFAITPSKNVRYAIMIDPLLRILAASTRIRWFFFAAVAVADLWLFCAVFIRAQIYDPVSDNLLRALRVIP
jgi:hypothetical protein